MTSIGISINIMSHPGGTDREAKASQREIEEERERNDDDIVQNMSLDVVRSETSIPNNQFAGAFNGSEASIPRPQSTIGGTDNDNVNWNMGYNQMFNFENRRLSMTPSDRPLLQPAFSNDAIFDIDNYENLTEDLGRNPLIDMNETLTDTIKDNNVSVAYPRGNPSELIATSSIPNNFEQQYIFSLYSRGNCAPQRRDENMEGKPAAIDSALFQQQHQQLRQHQPVNLTQPVFDQNAHRPLQNCKAPPVASAAGESTRLPKEKRKSQKELNVTQVSSILTGSRRRSNRIITKKVKEVVPTKAFPKVVKHPRVKTRAGFKKKMHIVTQLPKPTEKQLREAKTPRKIEALQTWYKRLGELIEFKDANGHANVPQQYKENHSLGIWVNKQRMEKKSKDAGKSSSLTDEKIQLLEEAGFVWAKRKGQVAWEEKFRELQEYLLKNGNCNVPTKNKHNRALGRWVSTQRANYKKFMTGQSTKQPRMDRHEMERRIKRLNAIDFTWSLLPGKSESDGDDSDSKDSIDETDSNPSPVKREEEEEKDEDDNEVDVEGDVQNDSVEIALV